MHPTELQPYVSQSKHRSVWERILKTGDVDHEGASLLDTYYRAIRNFGERADLLADDPDAVVANYLLSIERIFTAVHDIREKISKLIQPITTRLDKERKSWQRIAQLHTLNLHELTPADWDQILRIHTYSTVSKNRDAGENFDAEDTHFIPPEIVIQFEALLSKWPELAHAISYEMDQRFIKRVATRMNASSERISQAESAIVRLDTDIALYQAQQIELRQKIDEGPLSFEDIVSLARKLLPAQSLDDQPSQERPELEQALSLVDRKINIAPTGLTNYLPLRQEKNRLTYLEQAAKSPQVQQQLGLYAEYQSQQIKLDQAVYTKRTLREQIAREKASLAAD